MTRTKNYKIGVHGCDDSTYIEIDLTIREFRLVDRIARLISDASTYGCMPTMNVEEVSNVHHSIMAFRARG